MVFAPVSPFTLDGLKKFLSIAYHQFLNDAIYAFAETGLADQMIHVVPDRDFTIEEITSYSIEYYEHMCMVVLWNQLMMINILFLLNLV